MFFLPGESFVMFFPSRKISASLFSRPAIILSAVDFPLPEGQTIHVKVPFSASKETLKLKLLNVLFILCALK